ncbi:MAG: hypothetical protein M1812_000311 [Candelaria pacifica]|nr:MAG: hypothetical protein M1812_000311 [Candelaria pacifica]
MEALDNSPLCAISGLHRPAERKRAIHVRRNLNLPAIITDNNIREVSRQDPPSPPPNPPPSPTYLCLVRFIDTEEALWTDSEEPVVPKYLEAQD